MDFPLSEFTAWFESNEEKILADFFQFLRFRSISTDTACKEECLKAADFLFSFFKKIGMKVDLLESAGLPVVFAESQNTNKEIPSVLIYHHYDVQPVDPIDLWQSDPFNPRLIDGKVFARGASDNKGQCFITLTVLSAFSVLAKELPLHIKVFIEGEEESGGVGTGQVIKERKDLLKADSLCVIDFDLPSPGTPGIVGGYRGLAAVEIECSNAKGDLHSGTHGGVALNPLRILSQALTKLWDEKGSVAIPHFYDDVEPLSEKEKAQIDFSFDEEKYKEEFGIGALAKEEGFNAQESRWIRPTVEINGMWGGYTGPGFKTVIPAVAHAKLSCRLVSLQDPQKIEKYLQEFLKKNTPKGAEIKVKWHHGAKGYKTSMASPLTQAVTKSMETVFKTACRNTLCGGSIPIVRELAEAVGGDVALFGFALATDNIHAPNEHFRWDCFKKGFLTVASILWELSQKKKE